MRSDLTGSLFKSDPRDVLSPLHWWLTCDATARQEDEELKEHVLKVSNLVSQSPYCTSVFSWVHPYFTSRNTKKIIFLNSQFLFLSPLIEWSHGWPEAVIVTRHENTRWWRSSTPQLPPPSSPGSRRERRTSRRIFSTTTKPCWSRQVLKSGRKYSISAPSWL